MEEKASRKERKKEVVEVRRGHLPTVPPAPFLGARLSPTPPILATPPSGPLPLAGRWVEAQGHPDTSLLSAGGGERS